MSNVSFLPLRIWGISLEYEAMRSGDITKLSYNSFSQVVRIEHGLPFSGTVATTEMGYAKFLAIKRMLARKPKNKATWRRVSVRWKEWRKHDARYDKHSQEESKI